MPREADLSLERLLQERAPGTDIAELARHLGVSEATVGAYLDNSWTVLDRTVIERLADFLQCDVGALLATTESAFFDPFRLASKEGDERTCHYLSRPDGLGVRGGRSIAYRDNRAIEAVASLLRDSLGVGIAEEQYTVTELSQFNPHLLHNCVVVGSPMVNPAAEMALAQAFGAEPYNVADQTKLPFTFRVPATAKYQPSASVETSQDGKVGIWLRKEKELLQADTWPVEEFRKVRIKKGRDYAAIVVLNHQPPIEPARLRKLIILSGLGGVGTEEAANALVDRYRDLEPRQDESHVWGVIELFYYKAANTMSRKILSHRWRCRKGGRCPVDLVRKKP